MPHNSHYLPDHDLDDEALHFRRKRRASTPNVELEQYVRRINEEDGKIPRPKRIRINWTAEENKVFYDTVAKHTTLDEQSLIREIVASMGGKRNWTQCKGHFRNLVFVNKIIQDEKTKKWSVNENAKRFSRGSSSKLDSEQSGSDGRPGYKEVENGKSQPLKNTPRQEEDKNDKDEDEDEVEDVELGGEDNDADEDYAAQDDGDDAEGAEDGNEDQDDVPEGDVISKVVKGSEEGGTKGGPNGIEQARTRVLKATRGEPEYGDRPRLQHGRRGSDEEDGKHTMPHRKQVMSTKMDNGTTYTPSRRGREMKRRNTADYRPASYAEGRRYLK